ncbi:sulfatase [Desmospora sp. 8437]|nr:sulfatase [Desmospora sp. 8437]
MPPFLETDLHPFPAQAGYRPADVRIYQPHRVFGPEPPGVFPRGETEERLQPVDAPSLAARFPGTFPIIGGFSSSCC